MTVSVPASILEETERIWNVVMSLVKKKRCLVYEGETEHPLDGPWRPVFPFPVTVKVQDPMNTGTLNLILLSSTITERLRKQGFFLLL